MTDAEMIESLRRMSPRLDMMDCEDVLTAADCIEQLVWGRDKFEALAIMNLQENGTHIRRAEAAEAKLAKALEVLRFYADSYEIPNDGPWGVSSDDYGKKARATLAELEKPE